MLEMIASFSFIKEKLPVQGVDVRGTALFPHPEIIMWLAKFVIYQKEGLFATFGVLSGKYPGGDFGDALSGPTSPSRLNSFKYFLVGMRIPRKAVSVSYHKIPIQTPNTHKRENNSLRNHAG